MLSFSRTLVYVLFIVSIFGPITAGRGRSSFGGGRHSYPSSRGHSGSHSYPSSGGLSGGGHSYPSSSGLSGTGTKPQSHGYPSSGSGLSGGGGSHSYPSGGLSGSSSGSRPQTHGYPTGGSSYNKYPASSNTHTSHTTVHHHYHYSPPQQIRYVGASGPSTFPVYQGAPPTYVYNYKNSGSKYGTLLAGLALFNLGALAGGVYAHSHNSQSSYKPQPGEVCKFGLRKENGDYEETKIDCQIITSFIFQDQASTQSHPTSSNTTVTSTTVTNTTSVNAINPAVSTDMMLPNGTLVMMNATSPAVNNTVVTVTTTTTNTTTNALDVKGAPIKVNPGMKCYIIRSTPTNNMRKTIDCGLLQTYADQSLRKNSAVRNIPTFTIFTAIIAAFVIY